MILDPLLEIRRGPTAAYDGSSSRVFDSKNSIPGKFRLHEGRGLNFRNGILVGDHEMHTYFGERRICA